MGCSPGHLLLFRQPWKCFPPLSRKLRKLYESPEVFKTFFQKCCSEVVYSGHVERSFDNLDKNLPVKIQVFLVKVQKRRKTNFFKSLFRHFSTVQLSYCFDKPDFFFAKIRKNSIKVLKKMLILWITFITFSQSSAEDTWNLLLATCHKFFAKRRLLSLRDRKRWNNYSSLQKTSKPSAAPVGCSFEKLSKNSRQKSNKIAQRPNNLSKVSSFQRNVLKLFVWTLWK